MESKNANEDNLRVEEEDEDDEDFAGGIVYTIQEHFFRDDGFAEDIERWCITRCQEIDPDEEECRLEYTEIYKDFLRVFEEMITDVIEQHGSTIEKFFEELRAAPEDSEYNVFGQILNACIDFDVFLQMMKDTANNERIKDKESKSNGVGVAGGVVEQDGSYK